MSGVRIADMNWMQVEQYLRHDNRAVLPLGSTEQHSHLCLTVAAPALAHSHDVVGLGWDHSRADVL